MFQIVRDLANALRDVQNSSARLLSVTDSSARRRASKIRRSQSSSSVRASTKARRRLSRLLALEQRSLGTGRVVDQPMLRFLAAVCRNGYFVISINCALHNQVVCSTYWREGDAYRFNKQLET
jgi:hypothetical protein